MKVLIVVDMQNDFIDGALGTKEAEAIVPYVSRRIAQAHEAGERVIFTRDTHQENYMQTQEGAHLPVPHCIAGTHGWEITDALPTTDDIIYDKPTFGSWALAEDLKKEQDLESITIIGLCTDICVISNALLLHAALPEVPIYVDRNGCAGVTPESHEAALGAMKCCQINILP